MALRSTPGAWIEDTLAKPPWFLSFEVDARYAELLSRSRFALCPRGHGASSYRIFEAMQMARVPVVIADDWLPPEGPVWGDFAIHLPERDVERLPEVLSAADGERMGRVARDVWETWFAPAVQLRRVAERIESIIGRTSQRDLGVPSTWPLLAAQYEAKLRTEGLRQQASRALQVARRFLSGQPSVAQ